MARIDYSTLLEWTHTGSLAEDGTVTSDLRNLGKNEGYQIDSLWIYPPFDSNGELENLRIKLIIDGDSFDLGQFNSDLWPPYMRQSNWIALPLGNRKSNNPMKNTCLKGNTEIQIQATGGKNGVTGDFKVKVRGDYFKGDRAVRERFGSMFNPTGVGVTDPRRFDKRVRVSRSTPASVSNLSEMSGGAPKAPKPRVLPYYTYAWNANATTANAPYPFDLSLGNVSHSWEDLSWSLDDNEAVLIDHLAVNNIDNLYAKELWFEIADVEWPRGDPTTAPHFDVRNGTSELPWPNFATVHGPKPYSILMTGEDATVTVKDNGNSIPASDLQVALWGKKFEL